MDISELRLDPLLFYALLIVSCILVAVSRRTSVRVRYPPGPKGIPVFGNLLDLQKRLPRGPSLFSEWASKYGHVYSLRLGVYDAVVINSFELLKEAFIKHKDKTSSRATNVFFIKWTTGNRGIIQNEGPAWQALRRCSLRMMRELGMGRRSLEARIQEEGGALVDVIAQRKEQPFCPKLLLHNAFSNVLCSVIFGDRFEYDDEEFQYIAFHLDRLVSSGGFKNPEMFIPFLTPLMPLTNRPFCKVGISFLAIRQYLNKKVKYQKKRLGCGDQNFIQMCLEEDDDASGQHIGDALENVLFDLFLAGTETSTTSISWTLLYLVRHPEIQRRCRQDIAKVLAHGQAPKVADREKLPYVQAVIQEVLRIATVAPIAVLHRCESDMELSGFTIPKDTLLIPNLHHAHTDPAYWTDPLSFVPDRWIGPDGKLLQHEAYLPFSIGPRECMAKSMAYQEMFLILVSLLQSFTFVPEDTNNPPQPEGIMGFVYTPNNFNIVAKADVCL